MKQYDIHTNKTTPFWNSPTTCLKKKSDDIVNLIQKVCEISGVEIDYFTAEQLIINLRELKRTVDNQIEYRETMKGERV